MSDKTLIITGASRGIGRACAEHFLAAGWRVLAISRSACPIPGVHALQADLSEPSSDAAIAAWFDAELGPEPGQLCMIHNAARLSPDSAAELDAAQLRAVLELNVVAPARLNTLLLPRMRPRSSVLYVGSTLGVKAVPGVASYVTSKHALIGLMRATCQDLAGTGVHTACVCPGLTRTEMLVERTKDNTALLAELSALSTFGRLIEVGEIAELLMFAATSPVINGAVLHGNLGQIER